MKAEGGGQNERSKTASDAFQKPPDIYLLSWCSSRTIQSKRPAVLHLCRRNVARLPDPLCSHQGSKPPSQCATPINVGGRAAVVCQKQVKKINSQLNSFFNLIVLYGWYQRDSKILYDECISSVVSCWF